MEEEAMPDLQPIVEMHGVRNKEKKKLFANELHFYSGWRYLPVMCFFFLFHLPFPQLTLSEKGEKAQFCMSWADANFCD